MNRDDIIRMALEAGFCKDSSGIYFSRDVTPDSDLLPALERFAALVAAAEREKVAAWMRSKSYATGHGDTVEDLLKELEWQVAEREREACAEILLEYAGRDDLSDSDESLLRHLFDLLRARGET